MTDTIAPSRTDETKEKYLRTVERRRRKLASIKGVEPEQIDADDLINDLYERAPELKQNTIRFNRAAIGEWINCQESICEAKKSRLLDRIKSSHKNIISKKKTERRQIVKGIKQSDWLKIDRQIEFGLIDTPGEAVAGKVLRATLKTGLRPIEWQHARLTIKSIEELLELGFEWPNYLENIYPNNLIPVIFAWNAKYTNGRGRDGFRYVPVPCEQELPRYIESIRQDIESYLSEGYLFESWLNRLDRGCAKLMKKTFPRRKKHYTVYHCRHQFSAELKLKNLPRDVVAELMGHSSDETAANHYARKKSGWGMANMFQQNEPNQAIFIPKEDDEKDKSQVPPSPPQPSGN